MAASEGSAPTAATSSCSALFTLQAYKACKHAIVSTVAGHMRLWITAACAHDQVELHSLAVRLQGSSMPKQGAERWCMTCRDHGHGERW